MALTSVSTSATILQAHQKPKLRDQQLGRRNLLGALVATPAVAAALPASASELEDPHVVWWAEERRLYEAMEVAESDALTNHLNDHRWEVRDLIVRTPATTVAGMAVQIRLMAHYDDEGLETDDDLYAMLTRVADRLDHLAGRV